MNFAPDSFNNEYNIEEHRHRFAAWAAGRAAHIRPRKRSATVGSITSFTVKTAKELLEAALCESGLVSLADLPLAAKEMDGAHRAWRTKMVHEAKGNSISMSHGVAAKLINVYMKARFVSSSPEEEKRVAILHPPIDSLLLKNLGADNFGGEGAFWKKQVWSKLDSDAYEAIIEKIRNNLGQQPMWTIERYWVGHQL